MRCRERRRDGLRSSQIDDLRDHLDKTKTPSALASAIIRGITGWYRDPNFQIPLARYNPIRPSSVSRKGLTDKTLSAGVTCTPAESPRTSKQCITLTVPGEATTATHMLLPSPTGPQSSSRYSLTKSNVNGNSKMKHSAAAIAPNTHSSIEPYPVPKLLDSTPTLKLYLHSTAPSYHDHSPLS